MGVESEKVIFREGVGQRQTQKRNQCKFKSFQVEVGGDSKGWSKHRVN